MSKLYCLLVLLLCPFLFFSKTALAKIGVGVGSGKIQIGDKLKPGEIYRLPSLNVLNTGDEDSDYEVSISYHNDMPQLRPKQDWFIFSPREFYLKPGEVKVVEITLNLPLKMEPGDYFSYIEAHPAKKTESGKTSIGVAAATKLYFTVIPASFLQGIYYKIVSFWKIYSPWTNRIAFSLVLIIAAFVFKRFFNFQVNLKKASNKDQDE